MRRRLIIKRKIQRRRLRALRVVAKQPAQQFESSTDNFCLISAGLTDPFFG